MRSFRRSEDTTVADEPWPVVEEEIVRPPPARRPPPPQRPLLWPWLLLLLLLVAGGLVAAWLLTRDTGHKGSVSTVNVPNVVRLRQQEAVSRINRRGLVARITTRSSSAPQGTVVAQDPNPGANVTRRSVVTLSVALAQTIEVPDVLGQQRDAAIAAVRAAGLEPKAFVVSSTQRKGVVVAQHPQAGSRVAGKSTVRLNVSNGGGGSAAPPPPPPASSPPASVDVPDVTGQGQAAAQKQLNSSGLKAGVVYLESGQPQGTVVSQSPSSGATVRRGTRIQLNVALGSKPGTLKGVPEVRNLDPAAARSKLSAAGFVVQTLQQAVSDRAQVGKVVDEQPAGGRNAPAGSVITIYVGRASG